MHHKCLPNITFCRLNLAFYGNASLLLLWCKIFIFNAVRKVILIAGGFSPPPFFCLNSTYVSMVWGLLRACVSFYLPHCNSDASMVTTVMVISLFQKRMNIQSQAIKLEPNKLGISTIYRLSALALQQSNWRLVSLVCAKVIQLASSELPIIYISVNKIDITPVFTRCFVQDEVFIQIPRCQEKLFQCLYIATQCFFSLALSLSEEYFCIG